MSRDEYWRWFRTMVAVILWAMLCGLIAVSCLPPRAGAAPLPFNRKLPWLPNPVGEYEHSWRDSATGRSHTARITLNPDRSALYVYLDTSTRPAFAPLRWRLEGEEVLLVDNDGVCRYWLYPGLRAKRIK